MLFSSFTIAAAALASTAVAKTVSIDVGKDSQLLFSPNITTADPGDTLEFTFFAKNHTVTQGPFGSPCEVGDLAPSFFSGFMPTTGTGPNPNTFRVLVNDTTPIWIFCSQSLKSHCQSGMVMVVNQPAGAKSLEAYAAAAALTKSSEIPFNGQAAGGVFSSASGNSNTSGNSSSASTTSPASSTTSAAATSTSPISGASAISSLFDSMAIGVVSLGAIAFGMAL